MKIFQIDNVSLGNVPLRKAIDIVTSDKAYRHVKNGDFKMSPWTNNKRIVEYSIDVGEVPRPIRRFFNDSRLKVTCTESIVFQNEQRHEVEHNLKLHCFGSRFININPSYVLFHDDDLHETYLKSMVKVSTWIPPGIKHIVESFIIVQAEKDLLSFTKNVLDSIDS